MHDTLRTIYNCAYNMRSLVQIAAISLAVHLERQSLQQIVLAACYHANMSFTLDKCAGH